VRYELLLQSLTPGAPFPAERVAECLRALGAQLAADGAGSWALAGGVVEVRPLKEGGQQVATELRAPLSEKVDVLRELLVQAAAAAAQAEVCLFDLQLSRPVGKADQGALGDQFMRMSRYAGEMAGVSEAVGASFSAPAEGLKPTTKILLGLVGACVFVYFIVQSLLMKLR